jgi:predicted nucleotidyltransferase
MPTTTFEGIDVNDQTTPRWGLVHRIADLFSALPSVEAIALAGSQAAGAIDRHSDIDLYVYITSEIPLSARVAVVRKLGTTRSDLNLRFWDPGDAWYDEETGIEVDVVYWDMSWIEAQLDRVLVEHQASTGYSTCFWHTICSSLILYDRSGWLYRLKESTSVPFPEPLRQAIIAKNHPVLRRVIPSYLHQIEKAIRRNDAVSINHRVAALLASYFDVLFALNRLPNPGEKRLLRTASERCAKAPREMVSQVESVLRAVSLADQSLIARIEKLVDGLDQLLLEEGFDPETSLPWAQ